jgi:aspartyl-tRNA(Asn)/glutamyl-tRNA(Gln) amidotransferase subunit B
LIFDLGRSLPFFSIISTFLEIITKIIRDNSKQFEQYLNGKDKLFGFFVGQVMKETKGNADPKLVNELLNKKLKQ